MSHALAGDAVAKIMKRLLWKTSNVALRYIGPGALNSLAIEEGYSWSDNFPTLQVCNLRGISEAETRVVGGRDDVNRKRCWSTGISMGHPPRQQ